MKIRNVIYTKTLALGLELISKIRTNVDFVHNYVVVFCFFLNVYSIIIENEILYMHKV